MDRIQELLGRLTELSDAEVVELEGLIMSEFDATESDEPTTESVEKMLSLADGLDSLREEVTLRNERAEQLSAKAKDAALRVRPPEGETEAGQMPSSTAMEDDEDETSVDTGTDEPLEEMLESAAEDDTADEDEDPEEKKKRAGKEPAQFSAETTDADPGTDTDPDVTALSAEDSDAAPETADATATLSDESDSTPTQSTTTLQEENTVTASADAGGVVVTPPAGSEPIQSAVATEGIGLAITAGADIPGIGAGAVLDDLNGVAVAMAKRLDTLRNVQGGSAQQHTVATLSFEYPDDRQLVGSDPANIAKINAVTSPAALTAAAGICAPLETIFEMDVCGDADRPIRDALARFNADRGGVRLFGAPTLSGGVGIWDPATPTVKSCADATCVTPEEFQVQAVYACLNFSNFTNRFFPEVVKANTDLAMINHARRADMFLLKGILDQSTEVTPTEATDIGVTRQVVRTILDTAAYLRRKHRMRENGPLRVILPSWLSDAMAADLAQQMPGDGLDTLVVANAKIENLFRARNVNVTWSLDYWDATATPGAALTAGIGFDTEVSFPIFPEGSFLFLDGGTLDLGVVRDVTMLKANEYATFVETFENVVKIGCESLWIKDLPVCVSGAAAALVPGVC